jgi:hypothetical protein
VQIQIHRRVFGEQREHVVKKGNARFDFRLPFAVKVEAEGNLRFQRVAFDFGRARFHRGN